MKVIDSDISLGALTTARPDLARVLDSLGLDYCCGGARSLADACEQAGLSLDETLSELLKASPDENPEPWAALDAVGLVDHIEQTHHAYLRETLPWLETTLKKVIGAHGDNHPELYDLEVTFAALSNDLLPHLMKEEQVLFPMIRDLFSTEETPQFHCGSLGNPISVMLSEHDRVGELLLRINEQTSGYRLPSDACPSYQALYEGLADLEADTHLHVHKENNVLFAAVAAEEISQADGTSTR